MRFSLRYFLICLAVVTGFSSCEEELDPNDDYREIAVIYALLDQSQPVQYVKVTKAFLNTGTNAMMIAANEPDSTGFYHPITVELRRLGNTPDSVVQATYTLHPVPVNKDDGTFNTSSQVVYASDSNQVVLQDNELYQVVVTNTVTGK